MAFRDCRSMVGVITKLISAIPSFSDFSALSKHTLDIEYHVDIKQLLPQLSWGDTCQIWILFKESKWYICKIENFAYGEINKGALITSTPGGRQSLGWCMETKFLILYYRLCQKLDDYGWPSSNFYNTLLSTSINMDSSPALTDLPLDKMAAILQKTF